jgi:hypothetical protein
MRDDADDFRVMGNFIIDRWRFPKVEPDEEKLRVLRAIRARQVREGMRRLQAGAGS